MDLFPVAAFPVAAFPVATFTVSTFPVSTPAAEFTRRLLPRRSGSVPVGGPLGREGSS